jgi:hypothetical protein
MFQIQNFASTEQPKFLTQIFFLATLLKTKQNLTKTLKRDIIFPGIILLEI